MVGVEWLFILFLVVVTRIHAHVKPYRTDPQKWPLTMPSSICCTYLEHTVGRTITSKSSFCNKDIFEFFFFNLLVNINFIYFSDHGFLFSFWDHVLSSSDVSMRFSRQEYWGGSCALLQGIFLTQGWNLNLLCLLHGEAGSLPPTLLGKPLPWYHLLNSLHCWSAGDRFPLLFN